MGGVGPTARDVLAAPSIEGGGGTRDTVRDEFVAFLSQVIHFGLSHSEQFSGVLECLFEDLVALLQACEFELGVVQF